MLGLDIQWYTKQALCPRGAFPLLVTMHIKQIVIKINIKLQVAMSVVKEKAGYLKHKVGGLFQYH